MCISTAQELAQNGYPALGARHFSYKFLRKTLVTYPCAFSTVQARTERLSRSWGAACFPENSRVTWLLWHVHARFACAGSHKVLGWLWLCLMCRGRRSTWQVLAWSCADPSIFLSTRPLHDPGQVLQKILRRSWWDPLQEVLAWRSCRCHVSQVLVWELLWEAFGRFLSQDLVRSAPAATGPFMAILRASFRGPGMKIFIVGSSWRAPGEILQVSWHDLVHVLVWRSCGDPVEILFKRSLLCIGACMKVLLGCSWQVLVCRSCEVLFIDLYRRSCSCSCDHIWPHPLPAITDGLQFCLVMSELTYPRNTMVNHHQPLNPHPAQYLVNCYAPLKKVGAVLEQMKPCLERHKAGVGWGGRWVHVGVSPKMVDKTAP